jgi:tetratricopeptide (TPR) repeat protein
VIQRILSALVLILAGTAGAILLRPDLFPDVSLPAFLAEAPLQRTMLGAIVSFATGAILLGLTTNVLRGRRSSDYPAYRPSTTDREIRSPRIPDEPSAPLPYAEAAPAQPTTERTWAPLPPLREPKPPAPEIEPDVLAEAPPEAPSEPAPQFQAVPLVESPAANDVEPAPTTATPPEIDPAIAAGHKAKLVELSQAADAFKAAGRPEDAGELYDQALTEARAYYAAVPSVLDAKIKLAEALGRMALVNEAENRLELALQQHEESLSIYRSMAMYRSMGADALDEQGWARGMVGAIERLADCREVRGHRSRARDLYAEAVRITQRLSWLEPQSERYAAAFAHAKARFAALDAELQGEDA